MVVTSYRARLRRLVELGVLGHLGRRHVDAASVTSTSTAGPAHRRGPTATTIRRRRTRSTCPLVVTVSKTSGLHNGDTIKIHVVPTSGSDVYGVEARMCAEKAGLDLETDFYPNQTGNCVLNALSTGTDTHTQVAVDPPYRSADLTFKVGVGRDRYTTEYGQAARSAAVRVIRASSCCCCRCRAVSGSRPTRSPSLTVTQPGPRRPVWRRARLGASACSPTVGVSLVDSPFDAHPPEEADAGTTWASAVRAPFRVSTVVHGSPPHGSAHPFWTAAALVRRPLCSASWPWSRC